MVRFVCLFPGKKKNKQRFDQPLMQFILSWDLRFFQGTKKTWTREAFVEARGLPTYSLNQSCNRKDTVAQLQTGGFSIVPRFTLKNLLLTISCFSYGTGVFTLPLNDKQILLNFNSDLYQQQDHSTCHLSWKNHDNTICSSVFIKALDYCSFSHLTETFCTVDLKCPNVTLPDLASAKWLSERCHWSPSYDPHCPILGSLAFVWEALLYVKNGLPQQCVLKLNCGQKVCLVVHYVDSHTLFFMPEA